MAMTVLITLTTAGTDTGPFNLYSNTDGYVLAFESGISKASLVAGYTSILVPDGTTTIRVKSTGVCTNYVDIPVTTITTTTTTTPTPTPIELCVDIPIMYPYPVSAGNASSSGTLTNNSGSTIYVYVVFNSGGNMAGSINVDGGTVNGTSITMSGTVTMAGQTIYSAGYGTVTNGSTVTWILSKQDGLTSGATLRLGYSTTIGGPITLLSQTC